MRAAVSPHRRRGLGLIELLTIVAVLTVGLGLVVATARHVRSSSANELTRKRIQALVDETARLLARGDVDPTLPVPPSLDAAAARLGNAAQAGDDDAAPATANLIAVEAALRGFAGDSAERLRGLLAAEAAAAARGAAPSPRIDERDPSSPPGGPSPRDAAAAVLRNAAALAGQVETRDAWGRPIALMPRQLPALGIAPDDAPFFVSAGPDGSFLTLADNLYSYDIPALLPRRARAAATRPADARDPAGAAPAAADPASSAGATPAAGQRE